VGGVGDAGDLLAYRQMWEPFIAAHLARWRSLNEILEVAPEAQKCPPGIFEVTQITDPSTLTRKFCTDLLKTRIYTSNTHPLGILTRWNAWRGKSSAEMINGAESMLKHHQDAVMDVGGPYKDALVEITKAWQIDLKLPDLPTFSMQQDIRARIEATYIAAKGWIQLIGYGVSETLVKAGDVGQAISQGLSDTAKQLPQTTRWIGIAAVVTAVLVGGGLLIYYVPRRSPPALPAPAA
jgi:hypothetical protein